MAIALTAAFGRTPHSAALLDGARRSALLDLRFEPVTQAEARAALLQREAEIAAVREAMR